MAMDNNTSTLAVVIICMAACIFVLVPMLMYLNSRRRGRRNEAYDDMEGLEFEHYCAGLLEKNGFQSVKVTRASGDYGIDILAEKDNVTYAIQCKRYADDVGIKAVQEAYAGRDLYDRMVGAVLTNQYFTAPAAEAAKKLKILLWDREFLESLMEE